MEPRFSQLNDWLTWLETLHYQEIDLGLSRVFEVAKRLQLFTSYSSNHSSGKLAIPSCEVFTVAGTNGKGSCVKTIEQCLISQEVNVGTYTSPHIHRYNERIQINGSPVPDKLICEAFAAIDQARQNISLTYFEFGTLAALWIFVQQGIHSIVLEVGLGGRLDAVNIVDADIAIITSIALDHEEWLGSDLNIIAQEKLGITRPHIPVVLTESASLNTLVQFAQTHQASCLINRDFFLEDQKTLPQYTYLWKANIEADGLKIPATSLPVSSVIAGLQALTLRDYAIDQVLLDKVLPALQLEGRFQTMVNGNMTWIFDVAHNAAAAEFLAQRLQQSTTEYGKTLAVFTAMADKHIEKMVTPLLPHIDCWFIGDLSNNARAIQSVDVERVLQQVMADCKRYHSIEDACDSAINSVMDHDRIVVFGSFFTVAAIQQHMIDLGYGDTFGK